ncbi:MAG: PepSY domain-containing protein [Saccharofermentanales bacterium]|jgi:uncharacterized membrane protein YkoI
MKKNKMKMVTLIISALFLFAAVVGCAKGADLKDGTGAILLRVNPEISVHYDAEGLVTNVVPENDDAKLVVENVRDLKGEQVRPAVKELVTAINDAGFFVDEIDGSSRNITIEIAKGSVFPEEAFDKLIAKDVNSTLKSMNVESKVIGIDFSDYDDSDFSEPTGDFISVEQAKEIALAHAKVDASKAKFDKAELEDDDNVAYYDIEFKVDGVEFEYEIDAVSGQVLKYERDDKDVSDYDDDNDNDADDSDHKSPTKPTEDDSDFDDDSDHKAPTKKTTKPTEDDSDFDDDSDHKAPTKKTTKPTQDDSDFDDDNDDDSDYDD